MIDKLKARYARLPKALRFILKLLGVCAAPFLIVVLIIPCVLLWAVCTTLIGLIELYEKA